MKIFNIVAACAVTFGVLAAIPAANAQQFVGNDQFGNPMCTGPYGVAPCWVIQRWVANGSIMNTQPGLPIAAPATPVQNVNNGGNGGNNGLPQFPTLSQDGQFFQQAAPVVTTLCEWLCGG